MKVLVVDIGGSHVKLRVAGTRRSRRFDSGPAFSPSNLVERVSALTRGWHYDVVSIGYPGAVGRSGPAAEPGNLGTGWVVFDFEAAFGRPVRVVNDAALQALGAYAGGRMLFLGLGTGLGSALVVDQVIVPLELGELPHPAGGTLGDRLGKQGRTRLGSVVWQRDVKVMVRSLRRAFAAGYVVLGGGNARHINPLPAGVRRGGNDDAIAGGYRLWNEHIEPHDGESPAAWRVVP